MADPRKWTFDTPTYDSSRYPNGYYARREPHPTREDDEFDVVQVVGGNVMARLCLCARETDAKLIALLLNQNENARDVPRSVL